MLTIEILESPWDARMWMARADRSACKLVSSPTDPRPLEEQAWAMAETLLDGREGEEVVFQAFGPVARRLAESYGAQERGVLEGARIRFEVEAGKGYLPDEGPGRFVQAAQERKAAQKTVREGELRLRDLGRGVFAVVSDGPGFQAATRGLFDFAMNGAGKAVVDPLSRGKGRSASMKVMEGMGDGEPAALLVERLAQPMAGHSRVVRFALPTGQVERPFVHVAVATDGKATVEAPVFQPLRELSERSQADDLHGDPVFLLIEDGVEQRITYTELAERRAEWGERDVSGTKTMLRAFTERAQLFGRPVALVPLDEAGERPVGIRIVFEPDGTRRSELDLSAATLNFGPEVGLDAALSYAQRPAPAIEGVACCAERDLVGLGSLRSALPVVVVGQDHPLLPDRADGIEAGVGLGALSATDSMQGALLEESLRRSSNLAERLATLAELGEALPNGSTLAAPTLDEARILAVASKAALSARGADGVDAALFQSKLAEGLGDLRLTGLLPPAHPRLMGKARSGREDGWNVRSGVSTMERSAFDAVGGRLALPAMVFEAGSSALPVRRVLSVKGSDGREALATEQVAVSSLAIHLLDPNLSPAVLSELAETGKRLGQGPSVAVAPTLAEAKVLAAAADLACRLSAEGRLKAGFQEGLRGALREMKTRGEIPSGVAVAPVRAEEPAPSHPASKGWREAQEPLGRVSLLLGRLASAAAGAVVEAKRSGKAVEARLEIVMGADGNLTTRSGQHLGKVSELGFLESTLGRTLENGGVVSLRADRVLDAAAIGWSLGVDASGSPTGKLPSRKDRMLRVDLETLGATCGLRVSSSQKPLRPTSPGQVAVFYQRAGAGAAAQTLSAHGRPHDVEAADALAGVLAWRPAGELRMDAGAYALLTAGQVLAKSGPSDVREQLDRDLAKSVETFRERWGFHPDRMLDPRIRVGDAPEAIQAALRADGANLSGIELLAAAHEAARVGAVEGRSAHGVVLSWLGRDSEDLAIRLDGQAQRLGADMGLAGKPEDLRVAANASIARMGAVAAFGLADPGRFDRSADVARRLEQEGLHRCFGIGETPAPPVVEPASRSGLSPAAARQLLSDRLDAGSIGRGQFGTVLSSVLAEAERTGMRPALAAASSFEPDAARATRISREALAQSDAMRKEVEAMDLPPADLRAVLRHVQEREAIQGFAFPASSEERMLRGWALELHSRAKAPTPFPETLHALLNVSRTRPLSVDDVRAVMGTAAAIGRMEGKPARMVLFEAADKLQSEKEVSDALKSHGAMESVLVRSALRDAAREVGKEEWQGKKAAGAAAPKGVEEFIDDRAALHAVVKVTQALRSDETRAVSAEAELTLMGGLSKRAREKAGLDVEALLRPTEPVRAPSLRAGVGGCER